MTPAAIAAKKLPKPSVNFTISPCGKSKTPTSFASGGKVPITSSGDEPRSDRTEPIDLIGFEFDSNTLYARIAGFQTEYLIFILI